MPRPLLGASALALLLAARPALAAEAPAPLGGDPLLATLIEESLAARPELRQAQERARAERERIPQAGSLPDPSLSLGLQNDGFGELQIGKMETSFYQVMVSQGVPWPGKLGLRTDLARLSAAQADAATERLRLSTEADVRRGYLDLLLVRERLALLDRLEAIWTTTAGVARVRYEAGAGAQSDVLRAQLELNRLRQRRWFLESDERTAAQTLNRLRVHPLGEPIATTARVGDLPPPPLLDDEAAFADAAARSPELRQARLEAEAAETGVALARRDYLPDLAVSAGIMPRGALEPMWQAGVSLSLPVWAFRKQARAVEEGKARAAAGLAGAAAVEQVLRLRVAERRSALSALLETIRLYREGLLVQSRATADSTLAQYRVGRVTFASVLEANAGYIADEEGLLLSVADAQRIAIAVAEVSLEATGGSGRGATGAAAFPGAGAMGGSMAGAAPTGASAAGDAGGGAPMSGM